MNTNIRIDKIWCTWWLSWLTLLCLVGNLKYIPCWLTPKSWWTWCFWSGTSVEFLVPHILDKNITIKKSKGIKKSQLEKSSAELPFLKLTARAPARKLPSKGNEKVFPLPSIVRCELWDTPLKLDPPSGKPRLNWKYSGIRTPDRSDPVMLGWKINPSKIL